MKLKTLLCAFAIMIGILQTAQTQNIKGLYVNDFKNIVGDIAAENELLTFAQDSGFNYLILYNLYYIHNNLFDITNPTTAAPLSNFLKKARTMYGIRNVAAVGETFNSFNTIHDYNLDHLFDPERQFRYYNLEFEFWNSNNTDPGEYYCTTYLTSNGYVCDTSGAFDFYLEQLCRIDSLTDNYDWVFSETYIGNPTASQCSIMADCADRVLVHYYRMSDVYTSGNSIYNFKKYRLPPLASGSEISRVLPIFNCRPDFMESWLMSNPQDQAMDTWMNGLNGYAADVGSWKENTEIIGHVWYRYTCMHDTSGTITGNYAFEQSSNFNLFPNPVINQLHIQFNQTYSEINSVEIINQLGQRISKEVVESTLDRIIIETSDLSTGIYYVILDKEIRSFVKLE